MDFVVFEGHMKFFSSKVLPNTIQQVIFERETSHELAYSNFLRGSFYKLSRALTVRSVLSKHFKNKIFMNGN